jgi:hypothetical protein
MNAKQFFAVLALAMAGNVAMAVEASQDEVQPVSTLSRAEVKAQIANPVDGLLMSGGEATVFVDRPVAATTLSRDDVRAEGRALAHANRFNELYVG